MIISGEGSASEARRPGWLRHFFMICSGADIGIVRGCGTEWNKYAGVGATIFLTACLAAMSGSYALNLVFNDSFISVPIGIFWGIVIFNLDRYIVLSLRKEKVPSKVDINSEPDTDKQTLLKKDRRDKYLAQFYIASPRLVIAIIIAITVSKPFELRLFSRRIEKDLALSVRLADSLFDVQEMARTKALTAMITQSYKQEEADKSALYGKDVIYQDLRKDIPGLIASIGKAREATATNMEVIRHNQVKQIRYRLRTDTATGRTYRRPYTVWVPNDKALAKMQEDRELSQNIAAMNGQLTDREQKKSSAETDLTVQADSITAKYKVTRANYALQMSALQKSYRDRKAAWMKANAMSTDLPSRLEALNRISPVFSAVWWAGTMITSLFLMLETAPVLVKLLSKRGPYDMKLDLIEYEAALEESRREDELHREVRVLVEKAEEAAKLSGETFIKARKSEINRQLSLNDKLIDTVANKQEELALFYIDQWYAREKSKTAQHLDEFMGKKKPQLTGVFWRLNGFGDMTEYYFRAGKTTKKDIICIVKASTPLVGKWKYNGHPSRLIVELGGQTNDYTVELLETSKLQLKDNARQILLEFEAVKEK